MKPVGTSLRVDARGNPFVTRGRKSRHGRALSAAGWLARRVEAGETFVSLTRAREFTCFWAPVGFTVRFLAAFGLGEALATRVPGGWLLALLRDDVLAPRRPLTAASLGATRRPGRQGFPLRGGAARRP